MSNTEDVDNEAVIITSKSKEEKIKERDEKRKKISKGYYDIPEEEMQEIIRRAQKGHVADQEQMLKVFSNFLEKYVNMLHNSYYDLRDYDIKRFVNLYIADPQLRYKIKKDSLNLKSYKEVNSVIKGIIYMVKRYNNEDDIRQTVRMTFLECVKSYKQRGAIPFSGYLYSYFFFVLKRNVDSFLIDQLGLKSFPLITDDSVSSSYIDENKGSGMVTEESIPKSPDIDDLLVIESIDENWVMGDTCSFPFDCLTPHERQLVKWRYVDGLRPNKIAEKTSDHPNTCRQHIKNITEKIKAVIEENAPY